MECAEAIDYQIANKVLRKLEHIDITRVTSSKNYVMNVNCAEQHSV